MRNDYNGSISYDNRPIRDFTPEDFAQLRKNHISIVFQDLRLFPAQTVQQNLEIKRQLNPFHKPSKIEEMASRLGLADKLNSICSTCSYGEQQRIAIIRSLLQPFDFLLLDEPFSHLDDNNAQKAMSLMMEEAELRRAGIIFADLERIDFYPYTRLLHL
jgi:putative ABC transport system ATP-binding protein